MNFNSLREWIINYIFEASTVGVNQSAEYTLALQKLLIIEFTAQPILPITGPSLKHRSLERRKINYLSILFLNKMGITAAPRVFLS
jgi:hypothetical protein